MRLMTVSMETVRMANPNQERTNQNVRIYLKIAFPYDKNSYNKYYTVLVVAGLDHGVNRDFC